ncbi:hypothetical protein [Sphingomonas humi]|uniref:Uncharacterized protein n=1 Tax=Sphingomonas humi TaxID=335630 RepID=A0ABP7RRT5_9SPHN
MRLSLALAAFTLSLGAASAASAMPSLTSDRAYARCLVSNMQRIGAQTDEPHESVLTKAKANCILYERNLDGEAISTRNWSDFNGPWIGTPKGELVERAERAAVMALVKARLKAAERR